MVNVIHDLEACLSWWDDLFKAKTWIFQGNQIEVSVIFKKPATAETTEQKGTA